MSACACCGKKFEGLTLLESRLSRQLDEAARQGFAVEPSFCSLWCRNEHKQRQERERAREEAEQRRLAAICTHGYAPNMCPWPSGCPNSFGFDIFRRVLKADTPLMVFGCNPSPPPTIVEYRRKEWRLGRPWVGKNKPHYWTWEPNGHAEPFPVESAIYEAFMERLGVRLPASPPSEPASPPEPA